MQWRRSRAVAGRFLLATTCLPLAACIDEAGGVRQLQCQVTPETSAARGVPAGTLLMSDEHKGCMLGEIIVCPSGTGRSYDDLRCGEVQTGSVRRDP